MSFARKLHDLRLAQRLSLQDVAKAVGISKAHVFNLEKGITANPSMDLVLKLASCSASALPIWWATTPMPRTSQRRWSPCSAI